MKQFLLCTSFLFLVLSVNAQELRVVKDNINCSYGLKDQSGNWVIDPIYILIQEYNSGYFLVKDALGDGLLTPKGKWLIECKYDRLDFKLSKWSLLYDYSTPRIQPNELKSFFIFGVKGERVSLINSRGREIAGMSDRAQCDWDNGGDFLIYDTGTSHSTYIDTIGNILIDNLKGAIAPFREREYTLLGNRVERHSSIVSGDVQLINRKGESLTSERFDRALIITDNRICFERDSKYGVITTKGKMIIPPKYIREVPLSTPDTHKEGWVILDSLRKRGVMNYNGTVLLEPKYELVYPAYGSQRKQKGWMLQLGDKFGAVDTEGKFLVPLKYDQVTTFLAKKNGINDYHLNFVVKLDGKWGYLIPHVSAEPTKFYDALEPIMVSRYNYSHSIGQGLITKEKGKFGILNVDGSVHTGNVFSNRVKRNSSENYFFFKGLELKEFAFKKTGIEERIWKPFIEVENEIVFTDGNTYLTAMLINGGTEISQIDTRRQHNELYGNMFVVNRDRNGHLNIYDHRTSKKIKLQGIDEIWQSRKNRFLVRTKSNRNGVLDENGKIIVDTIYNSIQLNYYSNHIWASKLNKDSQYKWVVLDSIGVQHIKMEFDSRFEANSGDILVTQGNKTGLIDSKKFTWKIPPNNPCLFKMIGEFYGTISLEGKMGIVRSNGKYLLQPIYDSIILLSANNYLGGDFQQGVQPEIRWMVRKGTSEFLLDEKGRRITARKDIRDFKESLFFDDTVLLENVNQVRTYPVLDYTPSLHFLRGLTIEQIRAKRKALWSNPKIRATVFDSLDAYWNAQRVNCATSYSYNVLGIGDGSSKEQQIMQKCQCAQSRGWQRSYTSALQLNSIGDKFATISQNFQHDDPFGMYQAMSQAPPAPPANQYWNFIERNGKVEIIQLTDIFPSDSILMDEFVIALQKRDDLQLECSSLENMLQMVNGKFILTESGVELMMDRNYANFYQSYSPVQLRIPLENLNRHQESRWIVPILKTKI